MYHYPSSQQAQVRVVQIIRLKSTRAKADSEAGDENRRGDSLFKSTVQQLLEELVSSPAPPQLRTLLKHTAKWPWHQQPSPQGSPDHQGVYTVFCSHREILRKSSIKNIRCSTFDGTVPAVAARFLFFTFATNALLNSAEMLQ